MAWLSRQDSGKYARDMKKMGMKKRRTARRALRRKK